MKKESRTSRKNPSIEEAEMVAQQGGPEQNQMTAQQAVEVIYTALEKGQKAGAYGLREARDIINVFEGIAKVILQPEEGK